MRVDVYFGIQQIMPADTMGRVVAIIDVLRASTTIAAALHHGAKAVVPLESSEHVVARAKDFERGAVRLAGERKMFTVPGFDLGNSPAEFTRESVEGKVVLMSTTNGTPSLLGVQGARDVVVASYVNFSAVLAMLRAAARGGTDLTIVCAGRERQFSLEDAACAGRYARAISKGLDGSELNDGAQAAMLVDAKYRDGIGRVFADSTHGRALADAGFAEDLAIAARIDAFPVVPIYADRQITKLGPDRER